MTEFEDYDLEDTPRTAEEIAKRTLVLSAVITVFYGSPAEEVLEWLEAEDLVDEVTPYELEILKGMPPEGARVALTWKVECLVVLLWCICKVDRLPALSEQCDTELLKAAIVFPPGQTMAYISSAQLRDQHEIDDEHETVYQAHWAVRDAQINDKAMPDNLDPEVVYERHYAFNWVLGHEGQSWDDITTDT